MKTFILLAFAFTQLAYSQRTTKTNPLDFKDTVGIKLNLTTNGKAKIYLQGTHRLPSLYVDVADSGYLTANLATMRMLSPGLARTLVQIGIAGDGQFFVSGRTPGDSSSAFTQFLMLKKDSTVFSNAVKIGSTSTIPASRGFLWRNGEGDTLEYSYGSSPSVGKISFNGGVSGNFFRLASDGVYKPAAITGSDLPEQHIGYGFYSLAATDSAIVMEMPQSATVDSIRVVRVGGTSAVVMVKRDRASSFADLLSSNYTTTTSMATPSGLQNASLNANDVLWAVVRSVVGAPTQIFIQINYH